MANIIGSGPNQIPTNGSLGKLAFADYLDMSDIPNPFIVSSNNTEALRIKQTGTGNLLYATDGNNNERVYINNAGFLRLTSNTGSAYGGISLKNTYGSASVESINFVDFQNDLGIPTGAIFNGNEAYTGGSYISLYTTSNGSRSSDRRVEAMRIDANGNIGIGHSSPSAWYSTPNRLVVNQSANSITAVGIGNATSGLNAACALKYIGGSSYSYTQCQLSDNNGSPYFAEIHGSGVGFKHWTMNGYERMRLDASTGNFAIGTNDSSNLPAGGILGAVPSGKLHVHAGNLANTAYNALINSRYTCGLEGGNLSIFDIAHYRESTSGTGWLTTSTRMQQRIDWTWMAWQQFNGFGNPSGISWGTGTGTNRQDVPEKMRLDSSGNLGVGTNNPNNWGKFVVAGTSSGGVVVSSIVNVSGTAGTQAVLSFDTTNNGFNVRDCQIRATNDGLNQSTLGFYTSNADTPAERMRITAAGNLGIGTASPYAKLEVANNGPQNVAWLKNFGGTRSSPTEIADWPWPVLALTSYGNFYKQTMMSFTLPNDANASNGIYHTDDSIWNIKLNGVTSTGWDNNSNTTPSVATSANVGLELLGPGNLRLGSVNAKNIFLRTNNTDQVTIDSIGQVGIGTTSPQTKLHVTGAIYSSILTAPNYILNSSGSNYGFIQNDSANKWSLSSGTSPSTLGTPALTWNSSGAVGIGTTSPVGKLHVYSAADSSQLIQDANSVLRIVTSNGSNYIQSGAAYSSASAAPLIFGNIFSINEWMRITAAGNVGIGTGATVNYKLQVNGSFAATTKSFVIDHPTKPDMKLRYGSLESPYHGVRLTGEGVLVNGNATIELPDYIHGLCKQEGSQVQITNIKHGKVIWVEDIEVDNNKFTVAADVNDDKEYKFYWSFTAIRKDIEDMVVEFENE